ncbi:autotransporter domain-containing protein [Luteolibacter ambystomatis]|uniref:Autotransporter domain-containing protein n=1 Tax=Luteolibacter ambystomatis TaxID=2824561 RepID=A0A975G7D7_9BACT|nr:autotransporter outer membrane beta-barrel domain-containing protein [Luteolibacter ambystomatis]QUE50168.1 autotransporter domain-containing protein [Luteolibacter ambystomatis]
MLHAAAINPDTPGNVFVPSNYNGGLPAADSINASGGTTAPYTVTIQAGAILIGDPGIMDGIEVTSDNYTINNSGSVSGLHGIDSNANVVIVNNYGTFSSTGAEGIHAKGGSLITNYSGAKIIGYDDGVYFMLPGGTVVNSGLIEGLTAVGADGVQGGNGVGITNHTGGIIRGQTNGALVQDGLVVVNEVGGTFTGLNGDGINAANGASITNNGAITGSGVGNGLKLGNGAFVYNNTNFVMSNPVFGGGISGAVNGILAGDNFTITNQNLATVVGNGGDGIKVGASGFITNASGGAINGSVNGASGGFNLYVDNYGVINGTGGTGITGGDNLFIINGGVVHGFVNDGVHGLDNSVVQNVGLPGNLISGAVNGIWLDDNATVINAGFVGGTSGAGVRVSDGSTVTNTGTILGNVGIEAFAGAGTFVLTNSGVVTGTGGTAIDGAISGIDTLNLNSGSTVTGNIVTRGGADIINLTSGASSSLVTGAINMGLGNDTLNLINGQTAIGGATIRVTGLVSFTETINKSNAGVAFLNGGANVNTVSITGGGLYINGAVDGNTVSQATINAGGSALGGTGTWDANIALTGGGFSAGSVPITLDAVPTNAIGQLNLTGNVTHSAGTFIRWDVAPQTAINNGVNSDLIVQTGGANTYNVNGANIRISATNINQAIGNGTYTVVDSATGIANFGTMGALGVQFNGNIVDNGPFLATESGVNSTTTVLTNFFTTAALADGGTNIVLTVQHNFAGLPGITANQASLGAALDASVNSPNPLVQDFIASLDYSNLATVQATLAALDPATYLALTSSVINTDYSLHRQISDRLSGLRDSDEGSGLYRTQVSAKGALAPSAPASVSSGGPFNVWGSLSYDWQDYSGPTALSDFDGNVASFTVGIDYRVSPSFVLGVLLNGSKSDLDYTGGSSDIDSLRGAIYATLGRSTGWYSDALIGYGSHSIDATRAFGGVLPGVGGGSLDATSIQALWTVGYTFDAGSFRHGPFVGLEYQNVDVDGFNTGGGFPIGVGDYSVDSLRGLIGYRIKGNCGTFRPYASVAYAHEFEDGGNSAVAFLPNGAPFSVVGPDLNSAILLTAGTGISLAPNLVLDVGYRGEISTDSEGLDSHGGSVGLNYNF